VRYAKGLLIHVAADTTNLGVVAPIFEDMSFEYIPINNTYGEEQRTYRDFMALNKQYGQTLADFLPADVANLPVHYDPDFNNYIYGQDLSEHPRSFTLRKLERGDVLFFMASLAPYDPDIYAKREELLRRYQAGRRNKYIIGFFTVESVAHVAAFKSSPRLTLALLNIWHMQEGGEAPLDKSSLEKELEWLVAQGFAVKEGDSYRLTCPNEATRSGEEIVNWIADEWPEDERSKMKLLEEGKITILSGSINMEDVKLSHHYKRLRPLDLDYFTLIKGDPNHSTLLKHAVRLTECYEKYGFMLNKLGQTILSRTFDPLRGTRWINESAVKLLNKEITKLNPELTNQLA
jgi:hypothetical protein